MATSLQSSISFAKTTMTPAHKRPNSLMVTKLSCGSGIFHRSIWERTKMTWEDRRHFVQGLRELDEMAAKLKTTIYKLPQVKRGELLRDIERIRAQLADLLLASNAKVRPDELRTKSAKTGA